MYDNRHNLWHPQQIKSIANRGIKFRKNDCILVRLTIKLLILLECRGGD